MLQSLDTIPREVTSSQSSFHHLRVMFHDAFLREDSNAAIAICQQAVGLPNLDHNQRRELSQFYQMLGRINEAGEILRALLDEQPSDHQSGEALARILRFHESKQVYLDYINERINLFPSHQPYYSDKHEFLRENPDTVEREHLNILAKEHGISLPEGADLDSDAHPLEGLDDSQESFVDADLLAMLDLFGGRENCFARQWVSDEGKTGYVPVQEPLNIRHLKNHLLGIHTLGIYQLDLENRVKWIVFDLDVEKSHLNDLHDREFKQWLDAGMLKIVSELCAVLKVYQIQSHIEFSGYKGYHVWVFFQEKISANHARNFAQRIAAQVNLGNLPLSFEIFPKQSRVSQKSFGNLVKLPYGIHRISGLSNSMIDENGDLISFQDFIRSPKKTSSADFLSALMSLDPNYQMTPSAAMPIEEKQKPDKSLAYDPCPEPDSDPQWLCLKQHCHALWTLDSLIRTRAKLDHGQKIVLKHSCGHLRNGPTIVNTLMKRLSNYAPEDLLQSGFKGNAISCPKIRQYMKDCLAPESCACVFPPEAGMYPNPLLHLVKLNQSNSDSKEWNEAKLKELISTFLKLRLEKKEIGDRLKQTECDILDAFEAVGVSELDTPWGILKKEVTESGKVLTLTF